jgi:hypothetical protein
MPKIIIYIYIQTCQKNVKTAPRLGRGLAQHSLLVHRLRLLEKVTLGESDDGLLCRGPHRAKHVARTRQVKHKGKTIHIFICIYITIYI